MQKTKRCHGPAVRHQRTQQQRLAERTQQLQSRRVGRQSGQLTCRWVLCQESAAEVYGRKRCCSLCINGKENESENDLIRARECTLTAECHTRQSTVLAVNPSMTLFDKQHNTGRIRWHARHKTRRLRKTHSVSPSRRAKNKFKAHTVVISMTAHSNSSGPQVNTNAMSAGTDEAAHRQLPDTRAQHIHEHNTRSPSARTERRQSTDMTYSNATQACLHRGAWPRASTRHRPAASPTSAHNHRLCPPEAAHRPDETRHSSTSTQSWTRSRHLEHAADDNKVHTHDTTRERAQRRKRDRLLHSRAAE